MDKKKVEEWRGIRDLIAAEVITDTAEKFETGTPFSIAGVAELSRTTESSSEAHYYDNVAAVIIDTTGADTVNIKASALSLDVTAKITGQHYDESKGMLVEGERNVPYFAIGYVTAKTDGTEVFVWRLKGKFSIPDNTHTTKDNSATANGQDLIYTGADTTHKFTVGDKEKTAKSVVIDTSINAASEETFFATVQTPDTVKASV